MSFRVKVDLSQVFTDERKKVYVFIPDQRKCTVSWLVSRLGELVGAPRSITLMVDGHLLPSEETLEVLQIGDLVSAIPLKNVRKEKAAQNVNHEEEVDSKGSRSPSLGPAEKRQYTSQSVGTNNEALLKVKEQAMRLLNQFQKVPHELVCDVSASSATDLSYVSSGANQFDEPDHSADPSSNVSTFRENIAADKVPRRRRRIRKSRSLKVPADDFSFSDYPQSNVADFKPVGLSGPNINVLCNEMTPDSEIEVLVTQPSTLQLDQNKVNYEQSQLKENGRENVNSTGLDHPTPQPATKPYGRLIASS